MTENTHNDATDPWTARWHELTPSVYEGEVTQTEIAAAELELLKLVTFDTETGAATADTFTQIYANTLDDPSALARFAKIQSREAAIKSMLVAEGLTPPPIPSISGTISETWSR